MINNLVLAYLANGLQIFKELCRHYWALDPFATATYIDAYREMWDEDVNNPNDPMHRNEQA